LTRILSAAWHSPALIPQLLTLLLVERHWIVVADHIGPTGVHPIMPSARRWKWKALQETVGKQYSRVFLHEAPWEQDNNRNLRCVANPNYGT